ncbi:MAG: hypothetical protein M3Z23_13710 [Acidobacteriota bacterium]|nr:hypothetical protein [Acidobacteriota bacterium]
MFKKRNSTIAISLRRRRHHLFIARVLRPIPPLRYHEEVFERIKLFLLRDRNLAAILALAFLATTCRSDSGRIDPVLAQLVPANAISLFGARMDQVKSTPLYQKLIAQKKLPQLDQFASETGFDPRRDVRDLLVASDGKDTVALARGTFHLGNLQGVHKSNYKGYTLYTRDNNGYSLLDGSTAVAGTLPGLHAALDRYKSGAPSANAALLARAEAIPGQYQVWAVSAGGADFIARNMPQSGNGANFSKIFRSLENTIFEADLRNGLDAIAQGNCQTAKDAKDLGDAARGLVGFGRLSVPENQPELLKLWDGIHVDQKDKNINIAAKISRDLVDKLVQMVNAEASKPHPR